MSELETSLAPGGAHHWLNQLVGTWSGTTRTWMEPGKPPDTSTWRGVIKPVFDGRFVMHEYEGTIGGKEHKGLALYGCNLLTGQFECAWIDQFHMGTGIMFSEGPRTENGYSVNGSWALPGSARWGWRTAIEIVDADHITIRMYIITPEGEEGLGVETVYARV
jgi:hypothetical protein